MSRQSWIETLASQEAAGTLLNGYTTSKTVINPTALWTMPANYLNIGRKFRIRVIGGISNLVTTPGTLTMEVKIGSVVAFTTGAMQMNAIAHVTFPFWADIELTCRAVGNGTLATLMGQALVTGKMFTATAAQVDDVQDMPTLLAPATAPSVGTGFDSTIANTWDFWAGFSINNAANGIQVQQYSLESLN